MTRLLPAVLALAGAIAARAGATPPFEVIVPRSVTFYSDSSGYGLGSNVWGWLGATGGSLTQAQVASAIVVQGFRSGDLPASEFVAQSQSFPAPRALGTGQWQGVGSESTELLYEALMSPEERASRVEVRSLLFTCIVHAMAEGTGELQTDILIGTQRLTYYTTITVEYSTHEPLLELNSAQRVGSLSYVCPCDFNDSGTVNSQDFFEYLNCFFAPGCSRGDFNRSGSVDSQDFFDFLACFFAPPPGC